MEGMGRVERRATVLETVVTTRDMIEEMGVVGVQSGRERV